MVQTAGCHGNGRDHCCYWPDAPEGPGPDGTTVSGVCPFLRRDDPLASDGRRWSCGLRNELGSWAAVHADPRYLAVLQPLWRGSGPVWEQMWQAGIRCGTWPQDIPSLKANQVNTRPELKTLRDVIKVAINEATTLGRRQDAACCFGGRPPEPD